MNGALELNERFQEYNQMSAVAAHLAPTTCAPSHVALPVASEDRAAIIAAYARAFQRAKAAKLVGYRTADPSVIEVPSASDGGVLHQVTRTGPRWFEWSCDCKGANHPACQHRAVAAYCVTYGVYAVRPVVVLCETCGTNPAEAGAPKCAGCAALYGTEPTSIEDARAAQIRAERAAGIDPLASCFG